MTKYTWGVLASPDTPMGWIVSGAPARAVARLILPPITPDQAKPFLASLVLAQYADGNAFQSTVNTLTTLNKREFPFPASDDNRDLFVPVEWLQPEIAQAFTIQADPVKVGAPEGYSALLASAALTSVQPTEPGAYADLKPDVGTEWNDAIYQAALTGSGSGVLVTAPNIRYASAPISQLQQEEEYLPFYFVSPNWGEPESPLESLPVDAAFYEAAMWERQLTSPDDSASVMPSGWERIAIIGGAIYMLLQLFKDMRP